MSGDAQNTILAFVAIAALALVVQTIGMLAVLLVARKAAKNLREELQEYRASLLPVIERTRELVVNVAPKVEIAAEELEAIALSLRRQTSDVQKAAEDIIGRARSHVSRVDRLLTTIFDRLERAGTFMSDTVAKPMRQLSGLIASAKAVVETLRDAEPHRPPSQRHAPRYAQGEPLSSTRPTGTTTHFQS